MDPAEVFELTTGEIIANIYDRLMMFEPEDLQTLVGGVAQSWEFSNDGKTITFKIRPGLKFHSGNPVRAEDVAWSLQRVVKLNKTPAFIITQFGWNPDNVDDLVKVTSSGDLQITITENFSPALVLNALSAGIASVIDMKLVMQNEKDGDMGYDWLKSRSAGSGAFSLKTWKANELVTLEANSGYRHGAPGMKRVILRHVSEPSSQRLKNFSSKSRYEKIAPKLVAWAEEALPEGFTAFGLPNSHRRRLRTTNLVERLNEEIKRRTRVARLFPNEASCLRLVSAVLMEISEDWQTAEKRYVVFEDENENVDAIKGDRIYRKKVA